MDHLIIYDKLERASTTLNLDACRYKQSYSDIFTSTCDTINGSFPPRPEWSGESGGSQLCSNRCWAMCKWGRFGALRLAAGLLLWGLIGSCFEARTSMKGMTPPLYVLCDVTWRKLDKNCSAARGDNGILAISVAGGQFKEIVVL